MPLIEILSWLGWNMWTADIIDVGFINLVHIVFYFFPLALKTSSDTGTLVWGSLAVFIFR